MSSLEIAGITLACIFDGAMLGMFFQTILSKDHLSPDSKDVVKVRMGLIATMAALVLGLLTGSAKSSFRPGASRSVTSCLPREGR